MKKGTHKFVKQMWKIEFNAFDSTAILKSSTFVTPQALQAAEDVTWGLIVTY